MFKKISIRDDQQAEIIERLKKSDNKELELFDIIEQFNLTPSEVLEIQEVLNGK